jgi:phage gpG-like protein
VIHLEADLTELVQMLGRIERLRIAFERPRPLMAATAQTVNAQTETRIREEKRDPDGKPWRPWSAGYAATRTAQHSLLIDTQSMVKGVRDQVTGNTSAIVWAATDYSGYVNEDRPFMGVSDANANELESLLVAYVRDAIYEAV